MRCIHKPCNAITITTIKGKLILLLIIFILPVHVYYFLYMYIIAAIISSDNHYTLIWGTMVFILYVARVLCCGV